MASVNKVILVGNVGRDPETRMFQNGDQVTNFSIATSEKWKDKNTGEKKEATEWHRLSCAGHQAKFAADYVKKGTSVYAEGSIKTRKWTDADGNEKSMTEIRVDKLELLGGRPDGAQGGGQQAAPQQQRAAAPAQGRAPAGAQRSKTGFDDMDDDIPF